MLPRMLRRDGLSGISPVEPCHVLAQIPVCSVSSADRSGFEQAKKRVVANLDTMVGPKQRRSLSAMTDAAHHHNIPDVMIRRAAE